MSKGVDARRILKETSSYDTVGNAYFSLTIHALPAGWARVAVVTSAFHMPRTRALFRSLYGMAGDSLFGDPDRFALTFLSVSDDGIFDDYVLAARHAKEAEAVASWARTQQDLPIRTLSDFHAWMFDTHMCYAARRQHEWGRSSIKDERLLASY